MHFDKGNSSFIPKFTWSHSDVDFGKRPKNVSLLANSEMKSSSVFFFLDVTFGILKQSCFVS